MNRVFLSLKTRIGGIVLAFFAAGTFAHGQLAKKTTAPADDPAWVKKAAAEIDKRIGQGFTRAKVKPVTEADDARWVRRVYLDSTGRIPSYDEAKTFLDDTAADKRAKLVDKLLNSEGYVSHTYNWYADILRATSRLGTDNTRSGVPYLRWLRESVATNKPWDKMVFELLTTNGGGWEAGKGATGYFERDRGMPLDNMANTTRIFLGTHIECAQCHDHPYDKWKQTDFYEMSAFTNGLKTGTPKEEMRRYVNEKYDGRTNQDPDATKRTIYRWLQENIYDFGVYGDGKGNINLPMDFKGKGGKPGEPVVAKSIFPGARGAGRGRDTKDAREKFAEWITEPQNPRFTLIITNRLWKRAMGIGLFEPVDKFVEKNSETEATVVSNPAVLEYLQQIMKELQYDVKGFQKVLFNTKTYALGTNPAAVDPRSPYAFHARAVKRMTAEQVWDSMATLVVPDLDYRKGTALDHTAIIAGRNLGKSFYDVYKEVIDMNPAEITVWVNKVASSSAKGSGEVMMTMETSMMAANDTKAAGMTDATKWNGYNKDLLRASELPSPTSPQHFLRKFGQSSREVIEGGSSESDVTQVLSLINGHVEKNIVNESRAVIYKAIDAADSPDGKVKAAFLGILTRYPTPAELELMLPEAKKGREGIKNIIYALLNSNEFMFVL